MIEIAGVVQRDSLRPEQVRQRYRLTEEAAQYHYPWGLTPAANAACRCRFATIVARKAHFNKQALHNSLRFSDEVTHFDLTRYLCVPQLQQASTQQQGVGSWFSSLSRSQLICTCAVPNQIRSAVLKDGCRVSALGGVSAYDYLHAVGTQFKDGLRHDTLHAGGTAVKLYKSSCFRTTARGPRQVHISSEREKIK
jgi:hypothetical protein